MERAGRLLGLVPSLSAAWAAERELLGGRWDAETLAAADLAVARLRAAVELLVDQLYLAAFGRKHHQLSVQTLHLPDPPRSRSLPGDSPAESANRGILPGKLRDLAALAGGELGDDLTICAELVTSETASSQGWWEIAERWSRIEVDLSIEDAPGVLISGDHVVVNTGGGDDRVVVESDPVTGAWRVEVNGRLSVFPASCRLTLRTGAGDDRVTVRGSRGVTILSGYGDDVLVGGKGDDILIAGPGDDYLEGGPGTDFLSGGPGRDVLYGGPGDDLLDGGEGTDYLDSGSGVDTMVGGPGSDIVHIGAGGRLVDSLGDKVYAGPVDHRLGWSIRIHGSEAFVERVSADLMLLRRSGIGRAMLEELDRLRDPLVILEDEASSASWTSLDLRSGKRSTVFTVTYRTTRGISADRSPPIIGLFHELAHVYDFANRTQAGGRHDDPLDPDTVAGPGGTRVGAPNDERVAVGLPIDHDDDPETPTRLDPRHPYGYTENALREEMGLPRRSRYGDT
ncbi:MAG TPA: M91 family zinc metallopeptidase [Candidatus Limnocylindrales bacterium]|nr:M91 family zinc metallopeptidase [Candidatus Limnocylindrales bacterium]